MERLPILLHSYREGRWRRAIEPDEYVELNEKIAKSGYVDLVDVEAFIGDTYVEKVVKTSHECGVKVIASNHDFRKTPPKAELISRMTKMQELGADNSKDCGDRRRAQKMF